MKLLCRIVFSMVFLISFVQTSNAQDIQAQESKKARLEREIEQLQKQLSENSSRSKNALNELTIIRKQISNRRDLVAESDLEIKAYDDSISTVRKNASELQERLDTMKAYYERLVINTYKNRDAKIWYVYILSSDSFSQAARRFSYLRKLSSRMNVQAEEMKEMKIELDREMERLATLRKHAESLRRMRQQEVERLKAEEKRSDQLIAQLNRNKTTYQRELNTKRKQVENLNKEIERIIAQYIAESQKKSSSSSSKSEAKPIDIKLAAEFEANKGKLPWPADGPIMEKFGKHKHPVYTSIQMPFNNGISIAMPKGSEVQAVFDGEVKRIIVMPGYNKCVLVQHGNYFSFYCKLENVAVKAGDTIKTGQTIGTVDTIDGQTQLHFQIWEGKTPQNPELWLRKR